MIQLDIEQDKYRLTELKVTIAKMGEQRDETRVWAECWQT